VHILTLYSICLGWAPARLAKQERIKNSGFEHGLPDGNEAGHIASLVCSGCRLSRAKPLASTMNLHVLDRPFHVKVMFERTVPTRSGNFNLEAPEEVLPRIVDFIPKAAEVGGE